MTTTTITDVGASAAILAAGRALQLPTVRWLADELADQAARDGSSHRGYLAELLASEVDERAERRRVRRVAEARFPRTKMLADFDIDTSAVAPATLGALARLGDP